ncbi:uncharacterized protein LOC125368685 [Ricinus communis]|uniref:Uncharacterized protein n=1 Tax=Ricinus communis TaxID=3988 RepID=B9RFN6_RICCO|nr:uncharacterized protein LOC125368685 [Ricinus communis]EEF50007.1 conserved hypothetical protein [Ricinus communis]
MEKERKMKQGNPAQEEGFAVDDDEKVEKFFSIIRRLRDARDLSTNSLRETEARKRMKKAKKTQTPVWTPSFQLEDFGGLELADITQPTSSNNEQEKKKREELDLNLSL